jgi:hypothetical protein
LYARGDKISYFDNRVLKYSDINYVLERIQKNFKVNTIIRNNVSNIYIYIYIYIWLIISVLQNKFKFDPSILNIHDM